MSNINHSSTSIKENQQNFATIDKKYNILLIDDEESCLTALEISLFNTEYNVIKTSYGKDGLKYIQKNPGKIDIILLDLMMPDLTGLEVIREFNRLGCTIPIILQTASYNYSDISKALKLGAKNFISKPFDKKLLLSVLSKIPLQKEIDTLELKEVEKAD